jgi:hypothetical protein
VEVRDETTAITTIPSHTWPHYTSQCLHIFLKCPTIIARKGNNRGHISLCSNMRERIFLLNICLLQERFRIRITFCPGPHLSKTQGVTKRCRLSWLTKSVLSRMSPKAGGGGRNCGVSANECSCAQEPK